MGYNNYLSYTVEFLTLLIPAIVHKPQQLLHELGLYYSCLERLKLYIHSSIVLYMKQLHRTIYYTEFSKIAMKVS